MNPSIRDQLLKLGFKPSTIWKQKKEPKAQVFVFTTMTRVDSTGRMVCKRNNSSVLDERPVITTHKIPNAAIVTVHNYDNGVSLVAMPAQHAAQMVR